VVHHLRRRGGTNFHRALISEFRLPGTTILILSGDAVAAALVGALVETLGYRVTFVGLPEAVDESMRRTHPRVCLVDCVDPAMCDSAILGHARMRGISVVIFGTSQALDRVGALVSEHAIETLRMPADASAIDDTLKRALKKAG
jgi:DNA-binding NtrC family response regulator